MEVYIVILVSIICLWSWKRTMNEIIDRVIKLHKELVLEKEENKQLRIVVEILYREYLKREGKCSYCLEEDTPNSFREGPCVQCQKDYFE